MGYFMGSSLQRCQTNDPLNGLTQQMGSSKMIRQMVLVKAKFVSALFLTIFDYSSAKQLKIQLQFLLKLLTNMPT